MGYNNDRAEGQEKSYILCTGGQEASALFWTGLEDENT